MERFLTEHIAQGEWYEHDECRAYERRRDSEAAGPEGLVHLKVFGKKP